MQSRIKIATMSLGLILGYTNLSADIIPGINSKGGGDASSRREDEDGL